MAKNNTEKKQTVSRALTGIIAKVSDASTVKVQVETVSRHPIYEKTVKSHKKYTAHADSTEGLSVGDKVLIEEHRPISKTKRWVLKSVVEKSE